MTISSVTAFSPVFRLWVAEVDLNNILYGRRGILVFETFERHHTSPN